MELTGRLTQDAAVNRTKDGRELVAFSVVTNHRYKTQNGGKKEETTYFNCAYWLTTTIAKFLKKGMIVTLSGRVGINSYKTKDGDYIAHLTFHVNEITILSGAKARTVSVSVESQPIEDLPF